MTRPAPNPGEPDPRVIEGEVVSSSLVPPVPEEDGLQRVIRLHALAGVEFDMAAEAVATDQPVMPGQTKLQDGRVVDELGQVVPWQQEPQIVVPDDAREITG